jgi:hypothetical protein
MFPRWQIVADRCPISAVQMQSLPVPMHSSQFAWWLFDGYTRCGESGNFARFPLLNRTSSCPRLTSMVPSVPSNTQSARASRPSLVFSNSLWIITVPSA